MPSKNIGPNAAEGQFSFNNDGKIEGYITLEDADKIVVDLANATLCALLTENGDGGKPLEKCKRDANLNIDFEKVLKDTVFNKDSLLVTSHLSGPFDSNFYFMSSLLRGRIQQVNARMNAETNEMRKTALRMLYDGVTQFPGHDADIKDFYQGVAENVCKQFKKNHI